MGRNVFDILKERDFIKQVVFEDELYKKLGEEKMYKYFTVARRTVEKCDDYKEMGDLRSFLKTLRKSLPVRDEVYTIKK